MGRWFGGGGGGCKNVSGFVRLCVPGQSVHSCWSNVFQMTHKPDMTRYGGGKANADKCWEERRSSSTSQSCTIRYRCTIRELGRK